jgi:hypothetical protein
MIRTTIGIAILAAYLASILNAQLFSENRVFCFAMFSKMIDYEIHAQVNGRDLSPAEILQRYRKRAAGVQGASLAQITNIIVGRERRSQDDVVVTVRYRVNGQAKQPWVFRDH